MPNIRAKHSKRYKITTQSNHSHPVASNLLDRNFKAERPNEKWVSDITYIPTAEGWLYLDGVMDLYSRKIVGWAMAKRMTSELVCNVFKMAVTHRQPKPGLLHHSDWSSQYAAQVYQDLLKQHQCQVSMSRKGSCWDNAPMESLFCNLIQPEVMPSPIFLLISKAFRVCPSFWVQSNSPSFDLGLSKP